MEHTISALIILIFIGISYVFSVNRREVCWQIVEWGLNVSTPKSSALTFVLALALAKPLFERLTVRRASPTGEGITL
ncbi:hypothetical protein [Nostoc sp.]|uniref:hypothetical protein n=1 Tax=Nostoc sp. TaxID=1180 RepID=UPI002FF9F092